MARTRNHQLKVWNRFDGGIQNVPADHFIQENSFTFANNLNNVDGTIRPAKGNKQLSTNILKATKQVAKENVRGTTPLLQFPNPITFINYADTVYYVDNRGSSFKQINPSTKKPQNALVTLAKDDIALSSIGGTVNASVQEELNKITKALNSEFLVKAKPALDRLAGVLRDNIKSRLSVLTLGGITVTVDNYKEVLADKTAQLTNAKEYITALVNQTSGDIQERMKAIWVVDYYANLQEAMGEEAFNVLFTIYYNNGSLTETSDHYRYSRTYCMTHPAVFLKFLDDLSAHTVLHYIGTNNTFMSIEHGTKSIKGYAVAYATLKMLKDSFKKLQADLPNIAGKDYKKDNVELLARTTLTEQEWHDLFTALDSITTIAVSAHGDHNRVHGQDDQDLSPTWIEIKQEFTLLHNELVALQSALDTVSFEKNIKANIGAYAVVIEDTETGAISNFVRLSNVYDKVGVSLTLPSKDSKYKYHIYRHFSADYKEVQEVSSGGTVTITPPYTQGAVPTYMYQTAHPPTDFNYIAEKEGVIFLARKDSQEIWYSEPNSPHHIKSTAFIKMPQPIKAMKSAGAGVFVWTKNNTLYLLKGTSRNYDGKNTLSIKLIAEGTEVVSGKAVASIDNLVVWLSPYSIHNTSGSGSAEVTSSYWDASNISKAVQSLVHRRVVYWLVDTKDGERKLLSFDLNRKKVMLQDATGIQSISEMDETLVGVTTGNKLVRFGAGDNLLTYKVGLKRFAGYSFDVRMRFDNFVIYHSASPYGTYKEDSYVNITVYIDDWEVGTYRASGTDATRFDLPNTNNTGYSIRFVVEGNLQVKSIRTRYMTHDWED